MTRKQGIIALIVAAVLAAGAGGAWYFLSDHDTDSSSNSAPETPAQQPASAPHGPLPEPVILVIDKSAILRLSKAGQDVTAQVRALADQAKAEIDPQGRALQADAASLKANAASMTPEQRQARVAAFENRKAAFEQVAGAKQNRIQMALANSNHTLEVALGPILKQVMADHHANLIVDKQVVIFSTDNSFDVSQEVVQKLDAVLPSVKVELPPENAVSQTGATP